MKKILVAYFSASGETEKAGEDHSRRYGRRAL